MEENSVRLGPKFSPTKSLGADPAPGTQGAPGRRSSSPEAVVRPTLDGSDGPVPARTMRDQPAGGDSATGQKTHL